MESNKVEIRTEEVQTPVGAVKMETWKLHPTTISDCSKCDHEFQRIDNHRISCQKCGLGITGRMRIEELLDKDLISVV